MLIVNGLELNNKIDYIGKPQQDQLDPTKYTLYIRFLKHYQAEGGQYDYLYVLPGSYETMEEAASLINKNTAKVTISTNKTFQPKKSEVDEVQKLKDNVEYLHNKLKEIYEISRQAMV